MGLFWTSREEKNEENNAAYAAGVEFGQTATTLDVVVHKVVDFCAGCISTNRGIELQENFNKGIDFGREHPKK